jgi:hypothetical protein
MVGVGLGVFETSGVMVAFKVGVDATGKNGVNVAVEFAGATTRLLVRESLGRYAVIAEQLDNNSADIPMMMKNLKAKGYLFCIGFCPDFYS